eukprot:5424809-Pyramimonas_sp.AAC.1
MGARAAVTCVRHAIKEQPSAPRVLKQGDATIQRPKEILDAARTRWENMWSPQQHESIEELA